MKLLKNIYRGITFKAKILFLLYAVAAVPTLILIGFLYQNLVLSLEEKSIKDISQTFHQQTTILSEKINKAISISTQMNSNKILNDFFFLNSDNQVDDVVEYNKLIEPVLSWLQITCPDEVGAVRFYTVNQHLFSNKFILPLEDYRTSDPCLSAAVEALREAPISIQYYPEERNFYGYIASPRNSLSIFTQMNGPDVYRTYLEVELDLSSVYQSLSVMTDGFETTDYILVRSDGQTLFSSNPSLFSLFFNKEGGSLSDPTENAEFTYNGISYIVNSARIDSIGYMLVSCTDFNEVKKPIENTRTLFILISLVCIGVLCISANFLVNRLLQRLSVIDDNICKIQDGDFDIHIEVTGRDTIDKVSSSLNVMAWRIRCLIEDVYENQIQMKNLQIKMLSQQVSSHFLYNTLECLKMRAELNDQREIAQGLTTLGKLLRYYANIGAELSSVQKELDCIKEYVELMNLIHKNHCNLQFEVDDVLLLRTMPNFVLQPLMENSIKHGGTGHRYIDVLITIREEDGLLNFTVANNGAGINSETLAEIRKRLEAHNKPLNQWEKTSEKLEAGSKSIGIYNTHDRIKLVCGYSFGISIDSELSGGTTIRFSIPSDS